MRLIALLLLSSILLADNSSAETSSIIERCIPPDGGDVPLAVDGGFILSPARAAYDACRIGAVMKCDELLKQDSSPAVSDSTLHYVTAIITATAAIFTAYASNRGARHLGLIP